DWSDRAANSPRSECAHVFSDQLELGVRQGLLGPARHVGRARREIFTHAVSNGSCKCIDAKSDVHLRASAGTVVAMAVPAKVQVEALASSGVGEVVEPGQDQQLAPRWRLSSRPWEPPARGN